MTETRARLGIVLFIASEAVFFILLILAYVTYHREHGNGPTAASSLDIIKTGVFSLFLFSSSATMAFAERAFRGHLRAKLQVGLAATMLLGGAFLLGQGMEYVRLIQADVTISRDLFGTTFFTLTGFHGLHVLTGLLMIGILLGLSLARREQPRLGAMGVVSLYWHFVDAVWVVIFGVVYLWAFL
jgi:heme/copper-type cytochrome/quinol oxidase subunit 3